MSPVFISVFCTLKVHALSKKSSTFFLPQDVMSQAVLRGILNYKHACLYCGSAVLPTFVDSLVI